MSVNNIKKSLISLVIKEINNGNWDKLTIDYMSKKLQTPSKKILEVCTSKHNLLDLWSEDINQEMLKNISKDELKEVSIKERLLELMLCRFDALSNRKKETNAFVKLSKLNIKESKNSIFRVYKAMELICNYAGINCKSLHMLKTNESEKVKNCEKQTYIDKIILNTFTEVDQDIYACEIARQSLCYLLDFINI